LFGQVHSGYFVDRAHPHIIGSSVLSLELAWFQIVENVVRVAEVGDLVFVEKFDDVFGGAGYDAGFSFVELARDLFYEVEGDNKYGHEQVEG
jgi:hypothetical protein